MIATNIVWDTEDNGEVIPQEELGLPSDVTIPDAIDEDGVADYLSDKYGYLVYSFVLEENPPKNQKIVIDLPNGYKLVAEQNSDPNFSKEIFVGVIDPNGVWNQDLAIIRPSYKYDGDTPVWSQDKFDILVYADKDNEDFTDDFTVELFQGED